jgi:hypothetical protein
MNSWVKRFALLAVCAGAVFSQVWAADPVLYGAAYNGPGAPASLYKVNPNTGAPTLVGAIGFNQVGAIDFNTSGTLYGVGNRVSDGTQVLLQINPLTGAGTEVGPTGLSADLQDISFRNGDNALYAYVSGDIYTINTVNGAATLKGNAGDGFPQGNGMAFSPADTLYKADNLNLSTINQGSGLATPILGLNYPISGSKANGMDFDNATGVLWASVTTGAGGTNYLATINLNNGNVNFVGATQSRMDALAVGPVLIPEPGTITMVGLGLLGLLALRRQR